MVSLEQSLNKIKLTLTRFAVGAMNPLDMEIGIMPF
jgi:hypothetical protein